MGKEEEEQTDAQQESVIDIILAEQERIAKGGGAKTKNDVVGDGVRKGEKMVSMSVVHSEKQSGMGRSTERSVASTAGKTKDDTFHSGQACATSTSAMTEKERIAGRCSQAKLSSSANERAKVLLDYVSSGDEMGSLEYEQTGTSRSSSISQESQNRGSLGSRETTIQQQSVFTQVSEPGSIRVAGVGPEQQGSIRILSDPPESVGMDRQDSDLLVHAQMVDESGAKILATATPDPWWRRHQWWLAGGTVVVIGAIVVAVVLTTVDFGTAKTESPSMAPTSYSEGVEDQTVQLVESKLPPDATSHLADMSSPQYEALQWVIAQRLENEEIYSEPLVLQQYSLAVLFYGTGGLSSWIKTDGWLNSTSTCDWYGVQCSLGDGGDNAVVVGLNLTSNGMNGTVSSDIGILEAHLSLLDLSDNDLSGTIPEDLSRMTALIHLSLGENDFTGRFPSTFGQMTNLKHLDVSANSLGSTLPIELGSLTLLEELILDENEFSGEIPSQIGFLTALEHVSMSENRLSFALPSEMGKISSLKTFDARGNSLLGPLPTEMGNMGSLTLLNIAENFVFEKIPDQLGRLTSLTSLDLSSNLFTGTLPFSFDLLTHLSSLRVGGNFLDGDISLAISSQALELVELDLSSNFLTGSMPTLIYSLPRLESLNVSSNKLAGLLMRELESVNEPFNNLTSLDISSNEFTRTIPETVGLLSNLSILRMSSNEISGTFPTEITLLSNLVLLDVSFSSRTGTIVSVLGSMTALRSLSISGSVLCDNLCVFTGLGFAPIPSEIGALTNLREFRLFDLPGVVGPLPSELGLLINLESLDLTSNSLAGSLPSELGLLTTLVSLDVGSNQLSGALPSELGRLSLMTSLGVSWNSINGTIPTEIFNLSEMYTLSLSGNVLSGSIPAEIGMLTQAESLKMEWNDFVGTIPSRVGQLTNLKHLDLGGNNLSGQLPIELGLQTSLAYLSLEGNDILTVTIPSEVGLLTSLSTFRFDRNIFYDPLPSEIGLLKELRGLLASYNFLVGSLPTEIGSLNSLDSLDLSYNSLSGSLPSEIGLTMELRSLRASSNLLSGSLPTEIGRLDALDSLDLSYNNLSGPFPSEIGLLVRLKDLRAGNNSLTGSLPTEIGRLSALDSLDLSYNNLSGSIPDVVCDDFQILNVDCYVVECSCCGCPTQSPTMHPSESKLPTNAPTTSTPSTSLNPSGTPSLSFQPSLIAVPSGGPRCSLFSSVASIGSRLSISDIDNRFEVVSLPFLFLWRGFIPYNEITVTTNGVVFLGVSNDDGCCDAFPIEMSGKYSIPRIAVAQTELTPSFGGAIYTSQVNDDTFLISWEEVPAFTAWTAGVPDFPTGKVLSFQLLLYSNGNAEMRWGGESTPQARQFTFNAFSFAAGLEDDDANVTVPATGPLFDESGVSSFVWPMNQCRLFETTPDGGYS